MVSDTTGSEADGPPIQHTGVSTTEARRSSPDRAVTEILGYALIFALVLLTVGFVTFLGLPELERIQETEKAANAERAFDVVGDNMAAISERNVPSRSTEIDLGGSQLYYGANITMNVSVDGTTVADRKFRPVILEPNDDTTLIFEGGAIFRNQEDGGVVLRESPMLLRNDRVHVPIIQTQADALESAGGTTVLLRGESTARSVATADRNGATEVNITIENTPRYELWERHLESKSGVDSCSTDPADQSVKCEIDDVDSVYVTVQRIELSLIT